MRDREGLFVSKSKITVEQIKAARSLLRWSRQDLADAAEVSSENVHRVEAGDANLDGRVARKIQRALQRQGILFLGSTGVKPN
jgi:ribosome-binding protein aMBF1 (putative translation factor)